MLSIRRSLTLAKEPKDLFLFLCNLRARCVSTDDYDPPFSPLSKPTKPPKEKKKQKTKKQDQSSELVNDLKIPVISDLPFDFRYSYSETNPEIEPIGFREPKRFSPFGPGRLDRKWTGTTALASPEIDQSQWVEERARVLGETLTEDEVTELIERYRHSDCTRQINLGTILNLLPKFFSFEISLLDQIESSSKLRAFVIVDVADSLVVETSLC